MLCYSYQADKKDRKIMNLIVRNKIKELCHEKNMSLRDLSRITGVSHQQFSRDFVNLRLENVAKVITALDCKFDDCFQIIVLDGVK